MPATIRIRKSEGIRMRFARSMPRLIPRETIETHTTRVISWNRTCWDGLSVNAAHTSSPLAFESPPVNESSRYLRHHPVTTA